MLPFFSITFTIQLISSFYITSLLLSSGTPLGVSHPPTLSSNITTHWLNRLDGNTDEQTMNDVYGGKARSHRSKGDEPPSKGGTDAAVYVWWSWKMNGRTDWVNDERISSTLKKDPSKVISKGDYRDGNINPVITPILCCKTITTKLYWRRMGGGGCWIPSIRIRSHYRWGWWVVGWMNGVFQLILFEQITW